MNEKKKGRFNIIDLIIIIVVLLAIGFVAYRLLHVGGDPTPTQKVRITFFEEECRSFVPEHTHVGDPMMDGGENQYLGVVTDVVVDESQTYNYDQRTGEMTVGGKENYCSVYITGEVEGTMTGNGVVIGKTLYGVGHTLILHAGMGKYYIVIYDITPVEG